MAKSQVLAGLHSLLEAWRGSISSPFPAPFSRSLPFSPQLVTPGWSLLTPIPLTETLTQFPFLARLPLPPVQDPRVHLQNPDSLCFQLLGLIMPAKSHFPWSYSEVPGIRTQTFGGKGATALPTPESKPHHSASRSRQHMTSPSTCTAGIAPSSAAIDHFSLRTRGSGSNANCPGHTES